jgi:hypothetical protein
MQAITGVISNNSVEWLDDEIAHKGIDLDYENHVKECPNDDHDSCWESNGSETYLIGDWKIQKDGKYAPNHKGDYAAIVSECETQVVWSKHTVKVRAMCSPCFPGQADLNSGQGNIKAYTLPDDLIGNSD